MHKSKRNFNISSYKTKKQGNIHGSLGNQYKKYTLRTFESEYKKDPCHNQSLTVEEKQNGISINNNF
jgi:hypothetical protein